MGWREDQIDEEWDRAESEYLEQPPIRLNKKFLEEIDDATDDKGS